MKYRKLGNTDLDVSVICLGTMTFGEQNSEAEGHEQMDYALDQGVNFFDTAELYAVPSSPKNQGNTERIIGSWIAKSGNRDKVIIGSKITGPSPNLSYIRPDKDFSPKSIDDALEGSLKRLQTDYIDLYQLHWPARGVNCFGQRNYKHNSKWEDNFYELLSKMDQLVTAGKIRHFGISNETPWGLSQFLKLSENHDLTRCVSVQNPYNLLNRIYEIGMSEISMREQVGLLAYSPMAFGWLSGKYHKDGIPKGSRIDLFTEHMSRYSSKNCFNAVQKYIDLAKEIGISPAQMSLAFVNQRDFLTSNIIGATTMEQLKENIGSIDIELSKETLRKIDEVHALIPNPAP